MYQQIHIADIKIGPGQPLAVIAGPCVIENHDLTFEIAAFLKETTRELGLPFIFKASFDKANRTSIDSYRGPGMEEGLRILSDIKHRLGVPIISDVHDVHQAARAAQVLDVLQVPAFLCRQTDFILSVARCGKPVNIKKGQFLAPWDVANIVKKVESVGNRRLLLTERGAMFGYNNLVVDFRGIQIMQLTGYPVIFDATHSVQLPGGSGQSSGGQRAYAPILARSAVAAGADGIFLEVHPEPDKALCDGPNSLHLSSVRPLLEHLKAIHQIIQNGNQCGGH